MNISDNLIAFRETQDAKYLRICADDSELEALNVAAIELLSWLKREHKREKWKAQGRHNMQKPLRLNMKYAWCEYLGKALEAENDLSSVFIIEESTLRFKDDIDEEYRSAVRKTAFEKYNPERIL